MGFKRRESGYGDILGRILEVYVGVDRVERRFGLLFRGWYFGLGISVIMLNLFRVREL